MTGFPVVTAVAISGAFVFGIVLTLMGSLKVSLAKRLDVEENRLGSLLSILNLALIPMMLLSGLMIDTVGPQLIIILGSLLTAAAILGLSLRKSYRLTLLAVLLAGLGGACVSVGSVVLMPRAFPGPSLAGSLNLGNVFFGLGALMTPALSDLLLRKMDFRRSLGLLALACLVPGFLAALPSDDYAAPVKHGEVAQALNDPFLVLAGVIFLLYAPLEWSVGSWGTTYLTDLGLKPQRASWLLSGFWLSFLGSRLLFAYLQLQGVLPGATDAWLIFVAALLAAVALGNLAGAAGRGNPGLGLLLLGITLGPIFPTLVGILFGRYTADQQGTSYGVMFAIGSAGSVFLLPLIDRYAKRTSVQQALRLPMILALVLAAASLVLGLAV